MATNQTGYRPVFQLMMTAKVVDVASKRYAFDNNDTLKKAKRILSIESFHAGQITNTPTTGEAVVSQAVHNKAYFEYSLGSGTTIRTFPLKTITRDVPINRIDPINERPFDQQQSVIAVPESTGLTANTYFLFLVTYEI